MSFIAIYITHSNTENAKKICDDLINKKLIACYNLFPISSCYWWQGSVANENEIVSLLKTKTELWEKVKEEVLKVHPYTTPCIMKINVEANDEYEKWVQSETISL